MLILSFSIFLFIMLAIGGAASYFSKSTTFDYILAGRNIGPFSIALSAVSTCHSGFMFIGMIGFTYKYGVSSIWMIVGWLFGDYIAWRFVYPKLRRLTEQKNTLTISDFVTSHLPQPYQFYIKSLLSILIFIFVGFYAAAQLTAGSKALVIFLDISQISGIILGGIVVLIYSVSGGIRASIWTDVVQSIIMLVSMIGLLVVALINIGGLNSLFNSLHTIDPTLTNVFLNFDGWFILYVLGWCAFGMGVIGQPHILTRPMAIRSVNDLKQSRIFYFGWYVVFSIAAVLVGLSARVLLPELITLDTEFALPLLALETLPSFFVGLILAGIFSACISTADSQILVCSSTISQTFFSKFKGNLLLSRIMTFLALCSVTLLAIYASKSVFFLVIFSWSILALLLCPFIIAQLFHFRFGFKLMLASIIVSVIVVYVWVHVFNLSNAVNEVLPGFLVLLILIVMSKPKRFQNKSMD